MTKRNANNLPGGLLGRQKRRKLSEASVSEQSDPFLSTLQNAIGKEIEGLQQLTSAIDDADTDDDQPINEVVLSQDHKGEGAQELSGTRAEQVELSLLIFTPLMHETSGQTAVLSMNRLATLRMSLYTSGKLLG